ncbi:MAG TPA: carboxypeptidase-like regulatory domain-containing protein [Puia sp.]|nr:carboxypeptidase-like regulatory domain-containing protein [Puia sp.]
MHRHLTKSLLLFILFVTTISLRELSAQVTIKGTVYNINRSRPLEAVSVVSTSGRGTMTDSNGNYSIAVSAEDSISFSFLGRTTVKFPVAGIMNYPSFDVALHIDPIELKPVRVQPRNYHMDSLQNRQDYAKIFDYKKPKLSITDGSEGLGAGIDLDAIIHMFQFNKNRRMLAFQRRLIIEEQEKFIDHRFAPYLVKKITHFNSPELDTFMVKYRPSYYFAKSSSDYDFEEYIKLAARDYINKNRHYIPSGDLRRQQNLPPGRP